ncbi:type IV secretory system conjugative DNA transfer family protein [Halococcoides cellulosivorans]|uniref:type IV secretory system conjugative DNA transfer family protein n=1 Tax=Halococcoides cellulosivorans TaxID=1679096 RepID=UPI001F369876|nr:type IV secretory system conjugative DNA transfer family protein [Halococcoides cellulosivorans]
MSTHHRPSPTIGNVLDVLDKMASGRPPAEFLDVPETVAAEITTIDTETLDQTEHAERIADYARSVLLGLEDFTEGGQRSNLNGETTVGLDDRVVQFDLSAVADGSNEGLIMHIVLDWLFQRAKSSTENMVVMIDEAHYMLGHDQALEMLNLFARHSRHYGSGLTLISQTVDEFMGDPRAKEIYDQCDIRVLMRHQDIGDDAVEALGLTERERDFVLQAQAGNSADHSEGLLYVSDAGKMRMRVLSNDFEHHVVDGDCNVWAFLYDTDTVEWSQIPDGEREAVRRILDLDRSGEPMAAR